MAEVLKVGQLIDDEVVGRDAIHIAVTPVIATEVLYPGQRINFAESGNLEKVKSNSRETIGIVDPFLRDPVYPGRKFWMFLLPNTITSLRHEWTHPAWSDEPTKSESEKWVTEFAASIEKTYNALMRAATDYQEHGEWTYDNTEEYKNIDYDLWPVFWGHYEILTGVKVKESDACPFTCSC